MLQLQDSLSKAKKTFKPLKKGEVSMYNCGPTVYDFVHIGNLRSFLFADLLRRLLEHRGYKVTQIMNITDVGHMLHDADEGQDRMDMAAEKAGKTPQEVAAFYTEKFFTDIDRLNIRRASYYPKASEHVADMIAIIQKLLANGCAYLVGQNVYFDVSMFPSYGALSGNTVEGLQPGARLEVRDEKKHPADFALWIHNPDHLMQWEAPWGTGYPGWHIECSAMAMKYLGETIDIHTGGEDNKFPHHECEIAQSECATRKPFARFWLHASHLLVNGEKMSKSKGNFFTLDELLAKGYGTREIRYALSASHYRQQLNFTLHGIDSARASLERLDAFADAVRSNKPEESGRPATHGKKAATAFMKAFDDDMNIAEALGVLFDYVRTMNEKIAAKKFTHHDQASAVEFLKAAGDILGFSFGRNEDDDTLPPSIIELIEKRDYARSQKRFAEADRLRDELKEKGYEIEDTPEGRRVKRI